MRSYIWHLVYLVVVALLASLVVVFLRWRDESAEFSFTGQRYAPIGPIAELMKEADIPVDERSPLKVGVMRCWDGMEPGYRAVALVRAEFADSFGRRVHRHLVLMETPCEPSTPRNVLRSLGVLLSD